MSIDDILLSALNHRRDTNRNPKFVLLNAEQFDAIRAGLEWRDMEIDRLRLDAAVLRNLAGSAYRSDVIEAELRKARQEATEAAARE